MPHPRPHTLLQSIAYWCFNVGGEQWSLDKICAVAKELGCGSVELLTTVAELKVVERHGLTCALLGLDMAPDPPFVYGFNNAAHYPRLMRQTKAGIDAASDFGCPNMIVFTGFTAQDPTQPRGPQISLADGAAQCVAGLQEIVSYAAEKNVTLVLEPLSTRDDSHPMKGHPGYQGNHVDYCVDIIKAVDSPHLKLLFDLYHTQVMDGDLIRRIQRHGHLFGHVHTAGAPGRGELDDTQEINFRPVFQALVDIGYSGYVGHEYIPTRDPYQSLQEAVALCGSV